MKPVVTSPLSRPSRSTSDDPIVWPSLHIAGESFNALVIAEALAREGRFEVERHPALNGSTR